MQEFTHEDYARALMESPARSRLQFPDAPQPLALEYSRGRPGGAQGELASRGVELRCAGALRATQCSPSCVVFTQCMYSSSRPTRAPC